MKYCSIVIALFCEAKKVPTRLGGMVHIQLENKCAHGCFQFHPWCCHFRIRVGDVLVVMCKQVGRCYVDTRQVDCADWCWISV